MAHSNGHPPEFTVAEFVSDIAVRHATTGPRYRRWLWVTGLLFLVGIIGFVARAARDGFDERQPWGYFAATMAFLLTAFVSAPVVAVAFRMTGAHWRRPMARISELYSVVGVLVVVMFIPLMFLVPSAQNRRTLFFQGDTQGSLGKIFGAPHVYDMMALVSLVTAGIAMLWFSAKADRTQIRSRAGEPVGTWLGSWKQWNVMWKGLVMLGGLYFMMLVMTQALISIDFSMALVPGWRDAIFPAQQALGSLHAALAITILTLYVLRRYGHMEQYIHMEHFWAASKILLALSLLWFYFWWSGFIIFWYGRTPLEQNLLDLLMFDSYRWYFYLAFGLSFVAPFLTLLWNTVRRSTFGPALASVFILAGLLFDKMRVYVAAFSIPNDDITSHGLETLPATNYPDAIDLMMVVGGISGAMFLFLLAARMVPIMSIWEMSQGIRLRTVRRFLRIDMIVLGKSE
jgi:molybdopterin-containing oxidoreductase family membrane subunit